MKLLTKQTDYTIRAILHLAFKPKEFVSSKTISEDEQIPLQFLRRILQTLAKEKILISKEGAAGGVKLKKEPCKIKLTNLINLFQGEVELTDCLFRKNICRNRPTCVLRKRIKKIEKKVLNELENISIGTLIDDLNK